MIRTAERILSLPTFWASPSVVMRTIILRRRSEVHGHDEPHHSMAGAKVGRLVLLGLFSIQCCGQRAGG